MYGAAEEADDDDFRSCVVVERALDEEIGQQETPAGFRPEATVLPM
jgi:hypothetical protein